MSLVVSCEFAFLKQRLVCLLEEEQQDTTGRGLFSRKRNPNKRANEPSSLKEERFFSFGGVQLTTNN